MFELDHIGIVVNSLEDSVPLYCMLLGVPAAAVEYFDVPTEQVRIAMLRGNTIVELLEPLPGAETGLTRFLEKRGPGMHHICFRQDAPLEQKLEQLREAGLALLDETPRSGAEGKVFFVHPRSAAGVLVEFVEKGSHPINY